MPTFYVNKLNENAKLPFRANSDDAGLDLIASESVNLEYQVPTLVKTGIAIEIPKGYGGFVLPRSGLALNKGITVLNSPGLIDAGYRGEVGVILFLAKEGFGFEQIFAGDKIAQLVLINCSLFSPIETLELSKTERGNAGFGSSGT